MKLRIDVRLLKCIACVLVCVLVVLVALLLLRSWEDSSGWGNTQSDESESSLYENDSNAGKTYYEGAWYAQNEGLETVLVLGVDKYEDTSASSYNNNEQADFLLLIVIDSENENAQVVHLNRDTMTEISALGVAGDVVGKQIAQLALAHTYGTGADDSCENTVEAVSNLMYGIEIDHYVSMTMDGVALLNDLAGGVTVEVLDDFNGIDDSLVQGETVTLKGQQALTYVRTRVGLEDSSNLHRMERQEQYMAALKDQLVNCADQDADFILTTLLEVNEYLVSDCTIEQLSTLAEQLQSYDFDEFITLEGEAVVGDEYMEYYVDDEALQQLVIDLFYTQVEE